MNTNETLAEFGSDLHQADKIRIILVDDHPLMLRALKVVLCTQPDFEVVAECGDGEEAVRLAVEMHPDVIIMDINMPKLNGLEATRIIKKRCPDIAILALTIYKEDEYILGILDSGAAGYLIKSVYDKEIIQAIRSVVAGESVLSSQILKQITERALRDMKKTSPLIPMETLTIREIAILKLAARGMSNKAIAIELALSMRTVKGYLAIIFGKLSVGSRTEAVIKGLRLGILTLNDLE